MPENLMAIGQVGIDFVHRFADFMLYCTAYTLSTQDSMALEAAMWFVLGQTATTKCLVDVSRTVHFVERTVVYVELV